ncbi:MAG: hypothetical protein HS115_02850 [Spirochaetales bacterium]|nr:hypothetical protein [Spirochaetales bacterium]
MDRTEWSDRLLEVREEERLELAEELHHDLGQRIVVLKWELQHLLSSLPQKQEAKRIFEQLDGMADLVRHIAHRLCPLDLKASGIRAAVEQLIRDLEHSGLAVEADLQNLEPGPGGQAELLLYRVFQEAFTNIIRHSGAEQVLVKAVREGSFLRVSIKDDGSGLKGTPGLGMALMKRKLELLGGKIEFVSGPGTEVAFAIPW